MRVLVFNVAFPLFAKERGFDASQTGLMLAAMAISLFLFGGPLTILNARGHNRSVLLVGPAIAAFGIALVLIAPADLFVLGLLGCLLAGMASNVFWVMGDPLLASATPPRLRPQVFAIKFALLTAGFAAGGLIGGWVPQILSILGASNTGMYAGALMVVIVLDLSQAVCYRQIPAESVTRGNAKSSVHDRPPRFTGRAFWVIMLLMLVPEMGMATGYNSVRPYMSLFFDEKFGLSAGATGTAVSIMQLAGGLGALLIPSLALRIGAAPTMAALRMLGGAMIFAAVGATALPLVFLCFFVHYSVVDGTSATYVSEVMERLPPVQRTTFATVSASTWSLFSAFATSISGYLQDATGGFGAAFGLGGAALFASALWMMFVFPRIPSLIDNRVEASRA